MNQTICGVELAAFKTKPTPSEVGDIVARWDDADQAEFFMCFADTLRNCCGWKDDAQIDWIARSLVKKEIEACDGKGSQLIKSLAAFIDSHEEPEPLSADDQARIDAAWETHKAAGPSADKAA
jgi:hypothetical protein